MTGMSNSLQQALDLTDQILAAIDLQNLDKVSTLDEKRKTLIEQYYQNNQSIDANMTLLLKQKNDQIVSRLSDMRQQTRSRQIDLNKGQKVAQAYLANTNKGQP